MIDCAAEARSQSRSQSAKVQIYREEDSERAAACLALLRDLGQPIEQGALTLAYQPKLRLSTDRVDVVKALVRWKLPIRARGVTRRVHRPCRTDKPDRVLTQCVVSRALADQAWLRDLGGELEIHVKLSGQMVADEAFAQWPPLSNWRSSFRTDALRTFGLPLPGLQDKGAK